MILEFEGMGAWDPKKPNSVYFDVKTLDGTKRYYLGLKRDGALVLEEDENDRQN